MKFAARVRQKIKDTSRDPEEVRSVISRIEAALPHLNFDCWTIVAAGDSRLPHVRWTADGALEVAIHLNDMHLSSTCRRHSGPIGDQDYDFLHGLGAEATRTLGTIHGQSLSLLDFGTVSVSQQIQKIAKLDGEIVGVLRFVRSLGYETNENQRIAYGVIVSRKWSGEESIAGSFDNKRLKCLTDGFSTAILIDQSARICGYSSLDVPPGESKKRRRRPWRFAGLAHTAELAEGAGFALMPSGDVAVVHGGQLLFTQRSGRWQMWNHTAIMARLREACVLKGRRGPADRVLHYLYHVALDLSFRRSGGLLVLLNNKISLRSLLLSATDRVGGRARGAAERALDDFLEGKRVQHLDRRIVTDFASLDGALVMDRSGEVLAFGAMTKSSGGATQGSRTRAAVRASRNGVAIKVSSDGHISFYAAGREFLAV